ncbi:hypothetical protein FA15DRAFT_663044 [Coprinopsis marcescibilis]|uniref:Zinc-ribbon 15 domain-containing protein n=1 Tax=Coprinopsis marcescibilis TaxID=230819 RepID=A0A5C3LM50_COPMA|nr:hypothetical protein FA15DRAFT_663044 [Coprinopsis marcescibilis]
MDFFFCLPVLFGCKTTVKPEGDQNPRVCPRCNNAAVIGAKTRNWFEICFVPLVPLSSKHIWTCTICNWQSPRGNGLWEPALPGFAPPPPAGYQPPGWQPAQYQQTPPGPSPYPSQYPPNNYYPPK